MRARVCVRVNSDRVRQKERGRSRTGMTALATEPTGDSMTRMDRAACACEAITSSTPRPALTPRIAVVMKETKLKRGDAPRGDQKGAVEKGEKKQREGDQGKERAVPMDLVALARERVRGGLGQGQGVSGNRLARCASHAAAKNKKERAPTTTATRQRRRLKHTRPKKKGKPPHGQRETAASAYQRPGGALARQIGHDTGFVGDVPAAKGKKGCAPGRQGKWQEGRTERKRDKGKGQIVRERHRGAGLCSWFSL